MTSEGIKIQRDKIKELERRIQNLEGWNAEMYENHRIELARLQSIIDQGKYRKELDQTYIVKLKAQLAALYKK